MSDPENQHSSLAKDQKSANFGHNMIVWPPGKMSAMSSIELRWTVVPFTTDAYCLAAMRKLSIP